MSRPFRSKQLLPTNGPIPWASFEVRTGVTSHDPDKSARPQADRPLFSDVFLSGPQGPQLLSQYSDSLRAGRSGERIPVGTRFSTPFQTGPGAHPASYATSTGSFPGHLYYIIPLKLEAPFRNHVRESVTAHPLHCIHLFLHHKIVHFQVFL